MVGGAISGSSRQYVQYVIPGITVQTVVFGTAVTGIGLNEALAKGIIDQFRSRPIARSAVRSPARRWGRSWPGCGRVGGPGL